jgi:hypothetical protein
MTMTTTLQVGFVALASALILAWLLLALSGSRKADAPGAMVLRYGAPLRMFALAVALMLPLFMIYFIWNVPWRTDARLIAAGVSFFTTSVTGGLLLIEVERTKIAVIEGGIVRFSFWQGEAALKWSEIECVSYSALNRWIVVEGAGKTIRVSSHLAGVAAFVKTLRAKVSPERYVAAAAALNAMSEPEA